MSKGIGAESQTGSADLFHHHYRRHSALYQATHCGVLVSMLYFAGCQTLAVPELLQCTEASSDDIRWRKGLPSRVLVRCRRPKQSSEVNQVDSHYLEHPAAE